MKKIVPFLIFVFAVSALLAQNVNVTFNLNMENETVAPTGVYLAGGGTFGNPGDNEMTDPDGDNVYSITVELPENSSTYYTFTNGACPAWDCKENIGGQDCADPDNFNDRFIAVTTEDVTVNTCFGFCSTDGSCPSTFAITFQVDLSEYTGAFTTAYLSGSMNGWSGDANPLTDMGSGVYATTINLNEGDYQYKFTLDNWAAEENMLSSADPCTIEDGINVNRFVSISEETTLDVVCWMSCTGCTVGTNNLVFDENLFTLQPSIARDFTEIIFGENTINQEKQILVMNAVGQVVHNINIENTTTYRLNTADYAGGVYFLNVKTENSMFTKKFVVQK